MQDLLQFKILNSLNVNITEHRLFPNYVTTLITTIIKRVSPIYFSTGVPSSRITQ